MRGSKQWSLQELPLLLDILYILYMETLLTLLFIFYFAFIVYVYFGIRKSKIASDKNGRSSFSIIVCSNKGDISVVLDSLKKCDGDDYEFELIVVDDRSKNPISIETEKYDFNIHIIRIDEIDENIASKKYGINLAVKKASFNKIITIDDDTIFKSQYLDEVSLINETEHNYSVGLIKPVFLDSKIKETIFSNFVLLDFISFNLISIGCIKNNLPIFSNANNQVFSKESFIKVNPYSDNMCTLSGDDTYILQKFYDNSLKIDSIYNEDFVTETDVPDTIEDFINQRIRWGSISHKVNSKRVVLVSVLLYLFNLFLLLELLINPAYFLLFITAKTVVDTTLLYPTLKLFNLQKKVKYMPISELFMILYISIIPIVSVVRGNKRW